MKCQKVIFEIRLLKKFYQMIIFGKDNIVYMNAQNIERVIEENLTIGEEIGKIRKETNDNEEFKIMLPQNYLLELRYMKLKKV